MRNKSDSTDGQAQVESRLMFEGTITATDMDRATDSREKQRMGIFGTVHSYAGSSGRVTSEPIGRDLNPLGRGSGQALVGGALSLGALYRRLPMNKVEHDGSGNSVNNPSPQYSGFSTCAKACRENVEDRCDCTRVFSSQECSFDAPTPAQQCLECCRAAFWETAPPHPGGKHWCSQALDNCLKHCSSGYYDNRPDCYTCCRVEMEKCYSDYETNACDVSGAATGLTDWKTVCLCPWRYGCDPWALMSPQQRLEETKRALLVCLRNSDHYLAPALAKRLEIVPLHLHSLGGPFTGGGLSIPSWLLQPPASGYLGIYMHEERLRSRCDAQDLLLHELVHQLGIGIEWQYLVYFSSFHYFQTGLAPFGVRLDEPKWRALYYGPDVNLADRIVEEINSGCCCPEYYFINLSPLAEPLQHFFEDIQWLTEVYDWLENRTVVDKQPPTKTVRADN